MNLDMGIRWVHMGIECIVKNGRIWRDVSVLMLLPMASFVKRGGVRGDACMQYKKNQKLRVFGQIL